MSGSGSGAERAAVIAGVDIGGTTTQVILCRRDLTVIARAEATTPALVSGAAMAATAISLIRRLMTEAGDTAVLSGIGIGAAGVVDSATGRVLVASDSFVGWAGFGIAAAIGNELGVPAYLDNDVNAFLRGETSAGSIKGSRNALGITLGTGVGGALMLGGELWEGPRGAAGEIGHIPGFGEAICTCGARGHLETLASGRSIARRFGEAGGADVAGPSDGARSLDAAGVARLAADGHPVASRIFAEAAEAVATGILITAGLLDITTVVVGGGVSRSWPLLGPLIDAALTRRPPVSGATIRVEQSGLGADAVALGAAARARAELGR